MSAVWLWTAISLVGLVAALAALAEAVIDLRIARRNHAGIATSSLAEHHVRQEMLTVSVFTLAFGAGLIVTALPGWLGGLRWVLLAMLAAVLLKSVDRRIVRHQLMQRVGIRDGKDRDEDGVA